MTARYLQDVRGMSELTIDLCLLPVGAMVMVLFPRIGRLGGARGPRLPLVVSGTALALGDGASLWLGPATPLPAMLAIYVLFGVFLGAVNPPITNSAFSGMPGSMSGVDASLASVGRQTGNRQAQRDARRGAPGTAGGETPHRSPRLLAPPDSPRRARPGRL